MKLNRIDTEEELQSLLEGFECGDIIASGTDKEWKAFYREIERALKKFPNNRARAYRLQGKPYNSYEIPAPAVCAAAEPPPKYVP
jgi:hypothetical protein